ncbi:pre-peptidase C-terminal domain-containing protein [Leptolyngbya sp. FACHB-671]|uniref:COP23 domain-containing protein n=1 Tax=Leptolyngbya sp. FACHB-671 TaxID=2692812 RepID=UPI0016899934|nr:COP23 domain-containing protein [Leptolyngbya sp. FACHB-671]MBD2069088.1 pre-peptidase C-terminal domain-containing protein [Leptolyngbya sp. FACHB-671]
MKLAKFLVALLVGSTATISLLPGLRQPVQAQTGTGFYCDESREPPVMVAAGNGQVIDFITFTSAWAPPPYTAEVRCQVISARFQRVFVRDGASAFSNATFGYLNNEPVMCLSRNTQDQQRGICDPENILLTFQNELQGCLFIPAFEENLFRQGVQGDSSGITREQCNRQFSAQTRRGDSQARQTFLALNQQQAPISTIPYNSTTTGTGNYLLQGQGSLVAGGPVLSDGSLFREHLLSGTAGQTVTITLESSQFDTYLILLGPNGDRVAENDDISSDNLNSQITVTLPTTGVYRILANSYDETGQGNYTYTVR